MIKSWKIITISDKMNKLLGEEYVIKKRVFEVKVSLRGSLNRFSSQDIYDTVNYIEKNLLNELGLSIGNVSIYFSMYDENGDFVVPGIDQQGIAITHDYYFDEYLVYPNPKDRVLGNSFVPIDSFLTEKGALLPTEFQKTDTSRVPEIKEMREHAGMTVRELERLSGINGQIICEYEHGIREIPSEDMTAIKKAINDFAEGNYQRPSIESEVKKFEPFFQHPLSTTEIERIIEVINIGMTDDAIRTAIEITYDRRGYLSSLYMSKLLKKWASKGFYGGVISTAAENDSSGNGAP